MVEYAQLEEFTNRVILSDLGSSIDNLSYSLERTERIYNMGPTQDLHIFAHSLFVKESSHLHALKKEYKKRCPRLGHNSRYIPVKDRSKCFDKDAIYDAVDAVFERCGRKLTMSMGEIAGPILDIIRKSIEKPDWEARCQAKIDLNKEFYERLKKLESAYTMLQMQLLSGAADNPVALAKELREKTW